MVEFAFLILVADGESDLGGLVCLDTFDVIQPVVLVTRCGHAFGPLIVVHAGPGAADALVDFSAVSNFDVGDSPQGNRIIRSLRRTSHCCGLHGSRLGRCQANGESEKENEFCEMHDVGEGRLVCGKERRRCGFVVEDAGPGVLEMWKDELLAILCMGGFPILIETSKVQLARRLT